MPNLQCGDFRIWFGTDDAPAPSVTVPRGREIAVRAGVLPGDPELTLRIRYRRHSGTWMTLPMHALPREGAETPRYYEGTFRDLAPGTFIEYTIQCQKEGRSIEPSEPKTLNFEIKTTSRGSRRRVGPMGRSPALTADKVPSKTAKSTGTAERPRSGEQPVALSLGTTLKAAKLAGISKDVTRRLVEKAPDMSLLDDDSMAVLVAEGALEEVDVSRLAVAAVALEVTDGDEDTASKIVTAFESRGIKKPQDLVAMTTEEMTSAFESAGVTSGGIAAGIATRLRTAVGKTFPTEALTPARTPMAATTAGTGTQPDVKPEIISGAWKKNAGLDLIRMDLSRDSADRKKLDFGGLGAFEKKAFIRDIQLRQGALRAGGNTETADALLKKGITSAAAVSPIRLATDTGVSLARATTIHKRDVQHYGRLSNGLFTLWDAARGGLQDTAVGNLRRDKVAAFFDGLDNIQKLFGDQDSCYCEHCNSVLGPAAYFVDLMHFVQTHALDEAFEGNDNHPLHLKTRRPDLWVLPLTCENTHTEIPQLQITSEIFENFIAKKRGIAITVDRSEVVSTVYGEILPSGRHSVLQPLQLPLEELEIYLGHFKLRRSEIAELLNEPEDATLRAALGMSQIHWDLTTVTDASAVNIHNKIGLTLPADGIIPVKELLKATQLPREDLGELLESQFVGGADPLFILAEKKSAESVQFDIEQVHGVTLGHLDRIHRLLRLQRHLPWLPKQLDGFITSTGGSLNSASLEDAGRAVVLQRRFRASTEELCVLAGDLPNFSVQRTKTLDEEKRTPIDVLFNVPDLMREDGAYPDESARYDAGATSDVAKERSLRLRAGLRVDDGELISLVEGLADSFEEGTSASVPAVVARLFTQRLRKSPRPALPWFFPPKLARPLPVMSGGDSSFPLTTRNLSLLYRHAVMGRWLKLGPTDLLTLVRLTPAVGDHLTSLADSAAVVRFYDWWKNTRFSLEDLSMLLAPTAAIQDQVEELWEALQAWLEEQQDVTVTDTFLTQIEGVSEETSREIVTLNVDTVFEADGDGYRVVATWRNVDDLDLTLIDGTDIDVDAVRALVRDRHPDERLPRALTEALKIEIELARTIVAAALRGHDAITASTFLQRGSLPDALRPPLDALLRLYRIGVSLRLAPVTLKFFAEYQADFGITSWSEPNPQALRRIAATQALIKKNFRNEPETALADVQHLLQDATALPAVASTLFELEPLLAKDLAGTLRIPENSIDALFRLEEYAEIAHRLSIDAAALLDIASEDYERASAASAAVIAGFRAKYPDEDTWKEKVEPFQERVLEKKRDALIDYLLRGPDAVFPDTREMYKYFLIDGEVDGCFRTSRVVAASSSLQLYAHRIRMNLEKELNGDLHVEPSLIPDVEWEWRQHYRVWEANRKIFLWPENYLDPTIRDDKTPLFEELESELLQQEITEQTVVDAYSNYLKALEELANLRYAGAFHHYTEDDDTEEVTDIIYLFGATGGEAPTHYWREIRNLARSQEDELVSPQYGPWQKLETRIPTRHVSPVVHDGQLHVFWNEITTTSQNAVNDGKSRFIGYSHRYVLKFTSLRLDGQWTPPESVSLQGSAPTFEETDSSIDDPLAEQSELKYFDKIFDKFYPFFGIFRDSNFPQKLKNAFTSVEKTLKEDLKVSGAGGFDRAVRQLVTPRFGFDMHTKAQEGYGLNGFMWERPYISPDPSYGHRMLVNCAGMLVRGAVDLFDRQVLRTDDTRHIYSQTASNFLFAHRIDILSYWVARWYGKGLTSGMPDFTLLRRDSNSLSQSTWSTCPFDYPVAASLALNNEDLTIFERHSGAGPSWSSGSIKVADVSRDAGVWAIMGTPGEVVIETEDELFLLQPSAIVSNQYLLHRMGTTLVRDVARKLFNDGVDGLLATAHQLGLSEPTPPVSGPRTADVTVSNPIANDAAYGIYFQEIFQHIPLLIAHHLNARGKFEHAQRWYQYVFDPTSSEPPADADAPSTDRNWKYRQFRGQEQAKLRDVLSDTTAIQKYREDPFNAHAIARLRVSAYQKAVVMRYIDNLLDWGDERFTRFQMETVNEAMMLYVTAAEVLGPRPVQLGECGESSDSTRTYDKLKDSIAKDGELLLEVEELIPRPTTVLPTTVELKLIKPMFGLTALLAFPLSKAQSASTTEDSVLIGGRPVVAMAVSNGTTAKVSGQLETPKVGVVTTDDKTLAANVSMSQPVTMSTIESPGIAAAMVMGAMKGAHAAKASKGVTGFFVAEAAVAGGKKGDPAGIAISAGDLSTGAVPFAKIALAQPRTDALVTSFALRQQFAFLGGHWKANGGRRIPSTLGDRFTRAIVRQVSAAFCIPRNEILDDYWDRVEDRIQKIRTCRDITGLKRKLSLFAPPIDPNLLARARAAGISLDDALGAFEGMIPQYRFFHLLQKAKEFAGTVQSFGAALQSALERKDSEELAQLQAIQQQQILALTTKAKEWEFESAQASLEATEHRRTAVENRQAHYAGLMEAGLNEWEVMEQTGTHIASIILGSAATLNMISAVFGMIPQIGSPFAMKYGGLELKEGPGRIAIALGQLADLAKIVATSASLEARNERRREDWEFQGDQSTDELSQIEKQIEAAQIARDLAEHAIKLHEKSIEHNDDLLEYHEDKFSGLGLYTWLASQLQRTYREAYNMAHRMARYAEQAFRFEREDYTSELLSGQYWEAPRAGLLAGNRLTLDLQHLEQRYIEADRPKRELTDHFFSLRQWDPKALIELRQKGGCTFNVPELFFDLASPGDYRRRLRSARVTIPAVAGPYVNIMATLSLNSSQIRSVLGNDPQDAPRPRVDSITTSSARNDAGAFELNFNGEKYVPFEGAGAISEWSLSLPSAVRMFDYNTISDVVLHLDYTASFDGAHRDLVQGITTNMVASIQDRLADEGFVRAFGLKEELSVQYQRLEAGETVEIEITADHLPFFARSASVREASLIFTGMTEDAPAIGDVKFDGVSVGAPTVDEQVGGVSVALNIGGEAPWKHFLRVDELSSSTHVYLLLQLRIG